MMTVRVDYKFDNFTEYFICVNIYIDVTTQYTIIVEKNPLIWSVAIY